MSNYFDFCLFSQVHASLPSMFHLPPLSCWHSAKNCVTQSGTWAEKCGGADRALGEHQNVCHSLPFCTKHSFAPLLPHMDPIQALLAGESRKAHPLGILIKVHYL